MKQWSLPAEVQGADKAKVSRYVPLEVTVLCSFTGALDCSCRTAENAAKCQSTGERVCAWIGQCSLLRLPACKDTG